MTIGARRWLPLAAIVIACAAAGGCTRPYWRKQADDLTYEIVNEKQTDPRWATPRMALEADPRSRFYDPYDPDFEPLPPDDPSAHHYMHWLYDGRIKGWKHWHDFGDTAAVENPHWLEPFGLPCEIVEGNIGRPGLLPEIRNLSLEDAIQLSYVHSRDYQTQLENLYTQALVLTLQRFQFDVQFVGLGGRRPSSDVTFEDIPGVQDSVLWNPRAGVSQLLPAGGQWLVEIANNTLWLFADGNASDATATTLSYSLVQPLLAGGGKRFVLENLTQAERNVLYALRDFARFRMGFFNATVSGGTQVGLTSLGPGLSTGVTPLTTPTSQGGYLGLMQQYQIVANQQFNIKQFQERIDRLREQSRLIYYAVDIPEWPTDLILAPKEVNEGQKRFPPPEFEDLIRYDSTLKRLYLFGRLTDEEEEQLRALNDDVGYRAAIDELSDLAETSPNTQSIAQLETQLAQTCNQMRASRVLLRNLMDGYKLQLGLPPDLEITLDTSLLKPFEFIDPRLIRLQDRLNSFVPDPPRVYVEHEDAAKMARVADLMARLKTADPDLDVLRGLVAEMLVLRDDLRRDGFEVLETDFRRVDEYRRTHPPKPRDDCTNIVRNPERDRRLQDVLIDKFADAEKRLNSKRDELSEEVVPLADRVQAVKDLADLREDLLLLAQGLSVVQIDLRLDLVELNPFDMQMEESVRVGLENRLDLMNALAGVMDARRKMEVTANQLQAILDVVVEGDISTPSLASGNGNPFDFRGDESSLRAGVRFTSPVQLVAQRNAYRASQIGYQQARRNYMRVEDQVKFDVRTDWRTLDVSRQNFETAKEQLRAATAQLDIAVEQSVAPLPAGAAAGAGGGGAGGGAQGLNLLQALSSILQAQNNMIQLWVQYESSRLDMYNDMGILELDEDGFWVDEYYQRRKLAALAGRNAFDLPTEGPPADSPPLQPQEQFNDRPDAPLEPGPVPQPEVRRRAPHRDRQVETASASRPAGGNARQSRGGSGPRGGDGRGRPGLEGQAPAP